MAPGAAAAFALAGTTEEIVRTLLDRRERHGVGHVVVPGHAADTMRPVFARLA